MHSCSDGMVARCDGLAAGYSSTTVLRDVTFWLRQGQALLIVGSNGSGKSTLLRTLFCLQRPISGSGEISGVDLASGRPRTLLLAGTRYMGQGLRSFDFLTVGRSRRVLNSLYSLPLSRDNKAEEAPRSSRKMGSLSIGQRRIEALHLLSAGEPRLFLLDEPSSGIDAAHVGVIRGWIQNMKAQGVSFIVAEHNVTNLKGIFDAALVIKNGVVDFHETMSSVPDIGWVQSLPRGYSAESPGENRI